MPEKWSFRTISNRQRARGNEIGGKGLLKYHRLYSKYSTECLLPGQSHLETCWSETSILPRPGNVFSGTILVGGYHRFGTVHAALSLARPAGRQGAPIRSRLKPSTIWWRTTASRQATLEGDSRMAVSQATERRRTTPESNTKGSPSVVLARRPSEGAARIIGRFLTSRYGWSFPFSRFEFIT